MKNFILPTCLIIGSLALNACHMKNPSDFDKDLKKMTDEHQRNLDEMTKPLEAGGQPGSIKISGVIVKDDSQVDDRITVIAKGGLGKNGVEAPVIETRRPLLASKSERTDLSGLAQKNSLVAFGCKASDVTAFAEQNALVVSEASAPLAENVMFISAKAVLLCGKVEALQYDFLTIDADELLLDRVDLAHFALSGSIKISTNKLLLSGSNVISTRGLDTAFPLSLVSSIELNVLQEISSNEDGKLLLKSTGASYKATP